VPASGNRSCWTDRLGNADTISSESAAVDSHFRAAKNLSILIPPLLGKYPQVVQLFFVRCREVICDSGHANVFIHHFDNLFQVGSVPVEALKPHGLAHGCNLAARPVGTGEGEIRPSAADLCLILSVETRAGALSPGPCGIKWDVSVNPCKSRWLAGGYCSTFA